MDRLRAGRRTSTGGRIQGATGQLHAALRRHTDLGPGTSDFIADAASPIVNGAPNPLTGNYASHARDGSLPGGVHVIVTKTDASGPPVLCELRR